MIHLEIAGKLSICKTLPVHTGIKFQSLLSLILCGNNNEFRHGCKAYDILEVNLMCHFEEIVAGNKLQRIVIAIVLLFHSSLAIDEFVPTIFQILAIWIIWRKVTSLRFLDEFTLPHVALQRLPVIASIKGERSN